MTSRPEMQLLERQIQWARQYDGYGRLAGGHDHSHHPLKQLIDPARQEWRRSGQVPAWCGVDLLRGWAYFLVQVASPLEQSPERPEFVAVLNAVASRPQATTTEVPPLQLQDPAVPTVVDRARALEALCGDKDPWNRHIRTAWRACAEPALGDYPPRPHPRVHDESSDANIAYYAPLLHLLMYGIGWSQPALGLARWIEQDRPTEEPVLAVVGHWWGREVESFVAWMAGSPHVRSHLREILAVRPFPDEDPHAPEVTADDDLRATAEWSSALAGGWDPMHLSGHVYAPLADAQSLGRIRSATTDGSTVPRAVMITPTYVGWYAALRKYPGPTRLDGHDVRVDVVCPRLGWLGEYRRSAETGLWFRGTHTTHMLGN